MPGPTPVRTTVSPFQRLNELVAGIPPGRPAIDLGVGEPRHAVPPFVGPVIAGAIEEFGRYPAIRGTDAFRRAVASWLDRRYGLAAPVDPETMVLPLNGSREGLFFAALGARERAPAKDRPVVLLPNPFYQAYAAGAEAAGAEPVLLPAAPGGGAMPDLAAVPAPVLDRAIALYMASPSNPQGEVLSLADWTALIEAARRHDFMIFADECYSEIYRTVPPAGVLEAADRLGAGFGHVVAFHSLSKRSNLPGLRCGFAAGDPAFLRLWLRLRNQAAPQVPGPVQAVAVAAFSDEVHVEENRALYNAKYGIAEEILGDRFPGLTPPAGFFLWLDVGDSVAFAQRLWREEGVRSVPGAFLAAAGPDGVNPGAPYLRLAMVQDLDLTRTALTRLAALLPQP